MTKNYLTDEQMEAIYAESIQVESDSYEGQFTLTQNQLKALMNLAVETAIGEVVAYKFEYLFEQATEKGELDVWTEAVSRSYPKDMNGNHPVRNVSPLYLIQELDN